MNLITITLILQTLTKAAIIKHNRFIVGGFSFFDSCYLKPETARFLVTLPIYHSNNNIYKLKTYSFSFVFRTSP